MSCRSCSSLITVTAAWLPLSTSFLILLLLLPAFSAQLVSYPPILTSMSGCPLSPQDNTTLLCTPPFTLTLTGSAFSSNDVVNISNFACLNTQLSSDRSQLTCAVGNQYTAVSGGLGVDLAVGVIDLTTHLSSNFLTNLQLVPPPAPLLLTGISGCDGSGQTTNNCDLATSIVTVTGRGFAVDNQYWYLVFGASYGDGVRKFYTDYGGRAVRSVAYPIVGGNSIVLALNYTLVTWNLMSGLSNATGTMALCFTHGGVASNCLALSFTYAAPNTTRPTAQPTAGFTTTTSIAIRAVTGCPLEFAYNGSTSGCLATVPNRLTIVGSGFPVTNSLYVSVGDVRCTDPNYVLVDNTTAIVCSTLNEYTAPAIGAWLPIVIRDVVGLLVSEPAYLVQFSEPAYPTVASVTGCAGDGVTGGGPLATAGCDVMGSVSVVGENFVAGDLNVLWLLSVGVAGSSISYTRPAINKYIVDNSTIVLPLSLIYSLIQSSITSLSTDVTLYILHGQQIAGPVVVGLSTPPLAVTRLGGCKAALTANLTLSGCDPGVSIITIEGQSFSSAVSVTVGGQPCPLTQSTSTSVQCVLPIPLAAQKGMAYDIIISNFAGNITLPGAITYTSNPTIVSVTSAFCPPDFAYPYSNAPIPLYCSAYAQLTLVGVYFQELLTLSVNISAPNQQPLTCGNLTYQSSTELTCTLPPASRTFTTATPHAITVWENSTFPSNSLRAYLYTTDSQPNLLSVAGCAGGVDGVTRVVSGCKAGDAVTLVGSNFVGLGSGTQVQLWTDGEVFVCSAPRLVNSTVLTCMLPYMPALAVDSVVPIRIANMNGQQSNWLVVINYNVASSATQPLTNAANDTRFIVTLAVLLPTVAVLLALLVIALITRKSGLGGKLQQHEAQSAGSRRGGWGRQGDEKQEESVLQMSGVSVESDSDRL